MVLLLALYVAVARPFPSTAVSLHTCPSEQGLWSEGGGCPGAAAGGTPPPPAQPSRARFWFRVPAAWRSVQFLPVV